MPKGQDGAQHACRSVGKFKSFESGGGYSELFSGLMQLAGPETITRPYEQNDWVHACVAATASSASSVPPQIWDRDPEDDEAKPVPDTDPIVQLLTVKPNDHQTSMQFAQAGVINTRLDGENIWFLLDADANSVKADKDTISAVPDRIVAFRGHQIEIKCDRMGFPSEYKWPTASGAWWPASSVIHFRDYDPYNPFRGLGKVEVAARDIAVDFQAQRYQEGLLRNGGDPGGWIVSDTQMSAEAAKIAQAGLDEQQRNSARRGDWRMKPVRF